MRVWGSGPGRSVGLALAFVAVFAASAAAADYFPNVDSDGTHPASSCLSGSPDPCSLRDAVLLAGNGSVDSTVFLTAGHTYHVSAGPLLPGGSIVSPAHTTTIDGSGATIDLSGAGGNVGIAAGGTPAHGLVLENLTFSGAPQEPAVEYNGTGNLTVNDVIFTANTTNSGGPAGLYVGNASVVTITSTSFTGNHGPSVAGAEIDGVTGSATLKSDNFIGNQGDALEIGSSGPLSGPVSLDGVSFRQNFGPNYAGVLSFNAGAAGGSLHDVDIEGNNTTGVRPAVSLAGSFTRLDNVTIAGNTSDTGLAGGARLALTGTATANNWTVSGNQVTPSGPTPAVAGGLEVSSGTLRLNHATIADNSAGGNADDLHTSSTGAITVLNSIVAGSTGGGAVPCAADGGPITSGGHNIDLGDTCHFTAAGDQSNTDPRLGPLTNDGLVGTPGTLSYRPLLYGSPAVDAADGPNCPATDALGVARPVGVACDIGAVESPLVDLSVTGSTSTQTTPIGGGRVTYTFTVSDGSGTTPAAVTLTDALPAGATLVSASASQGSCSPRAQVVCALGAIHRGADVSATITAQLRIGGANVDTAHVESELPDANMTNDTTQLTVTVPASPVITGLRITPRAFHVKGTVRHRPRAGGATIAYVDSAAGRTTLTVLGSGPGVRRHGRCLAPPRHVRGHRGAACRRAVSVGALRHTDVAGPNTVAFSGKLRGRPLRHGRYTLRAVTTSGGKTSAPVTTAFTVLR